jgi:CubicO group peptidase (beta-lactamase class C family)
MSLTTHGARSLAALAVLVPLCVSAQNVPGPDVAALIARVEGPQVPNRQGYDGYTIKELMERFHIPGVSVAVIHNGRIEWAKGYGVADVESGQPVDTGTVFQAASISKPVFAMAVV